MQPVSKVTTIPIFPLQGLVLFPHTHLPLHIFEPRYVKMVRDALDSDKYIATANIKHADEQTYFQKPPINKIITHARVIDYEELPDNRYYILLEGICRCRIIEELPTHPYRMVKCESLTDDFPTQEKEMVQQVRGELIELIQKLAQITEDLQDRLKNLENTHLHPGIIADVVASMVVNDPYARQSILEESNILRRIRKVIIQVSNLLRDSN